MAADMMTMILDDALATYGTRHVHTITIRANLARCLTMAGHILAAVAALDKAIEDSAALLGDDDPNTADLRAEREEMTGSSRGRPHNWRG